MYTKIYQIHSYRQEESLLPEEVANEMCNRVIDVVSGAMVSVAIAGAIDWIGWGSLALAVNPVVLISGCIIGSICGAILRHIWKPQCQIIPFPVRS